VSGHGHTHGGGAHGHDVADVAELFTAEYWDGRYASKDAVWSGDPNRRLVERASGLAPGTALDIGCGEGADAIWLAARGWRVTGVDISRVALSKAAALAAGDPQVAGRITWRQADVFAFEPEPAAFDLVSSQFMHPPAEVRPVLNARLAAAVRPGGSLIVVGHDLSDLDTTMGRPHLPELMFTAEEVVAGLDPDAWEVLVAGALERPGVDPDGNPVTLTDAVVHAVRRP
jgi:SAM-dependent methyltransferase